MSDHVRHQQRHAFGPRSTLRLAGALAVSSFLMAGPAFSDDGRRLSLKDTIALTLANSSDTRKAAADTGASENAVRSARAAFLPTVRVDASAGTVNDRIQQPWEPTAPVTPRDRNAYDGKITLTQGLFSGLRDLRNLNAAGYAAEASRWAERGTRADTVSSVTLRYFTIQRLQDELAAEMQNQILREREAKDTAARLQAGRATELQKLQADHSVAAQRPVILQLRQKLEDERVRLSQSLGFKPDQKFLLTDSLYSAQTAVSKIKLPPFPELLKRAFNENPKLKNLESQVQQQRNLAGQVIGSHLPDVSFDLYAQTDTSRRRDLGNQDYTSYGGLVRLSIPIFSGLSSFSQYAEAASRVVSFEEQSRGLRESLVADLNTAWRSWELSAEQMEAERLNSEVAKATSAEAQSLWRAGRGTYTDMIQAWADEAAARRQLAGAQFDQISAISSIRQILGEAPEGGVTP